MKIWSGSIYIVSITALAALSLILTEKVISAPSDSASVPRGALNPRDQYFLIDKTQTTNNLSTATDSNVQCTDSTRGVYVGITEQPGLSVRFENCYTVKTDETTSGWGTTYYWPKCDQRLSIPNYYNIDSVSVQCAPAKLKWQNIGEHP